MMTMRNWIFVLGGWIVLSALAGCNGEWKIIGLKPDASEERLSFPADIAGTVGEYCSLISVSEAPISGWGIVVGLGKDGSSEVLPELKNQLIKYIKGQIQIGRASFDTQAVSAMEFLRDRDTAVVRVGAVIPSGAPKGTVVDVVVSAPARTQTTSLKGGILLPTELRWEQGARGARGRYLKPLAWAEGVIFVNPFLDPNKPADAAQFRRGQILGGARMIKDMPIRLELRQPDYMTCNVLQRRINERFRDVGKTVAVAKCRNYIEIHIPPAYRDDYQHFLQLIMHLPRRAGPGVFEAQANRIAKAMERPGANYDGLATVWEAMGRQVLPIVQKLYSSPVPAVSFYAARTGLRLEDTYLAGAIVLRFAETKGPHQLAAIAELGRRQSLLEAGRTLRALLNNRNELVRIAAYEALVKQGDFSAVQRTRIDEGMLGDSEPSFVVDQAESTGDFVIYATRTGKPKIVLFGKNMPLSNPVFYNAPQDKVTLFSKKALTGAQIRALPQMHGDPDKAILRKDHVVVYRKLPGTDEISKKFRIGFRVRSLIGALGARPRPNLETGTVLGLGLTYSQIVGILSQLCKGHHIPAKFVLQPLPELHRIYERTSTPGRPD